MREKLVPQREGINESRASINLNNGRASMNLNNGRASMNLPLLSLETMITPSKLDCALPALYPKQSNAWNSHN